MPLNSGPQPRWVMDVSIDPPSFLPAGLDRSGLLDITPIGALFRKYLHPESGKIHDGQVYHNQAQEDAQKGY